MLRSLMRNTVIRRSLCVRRSYQGRPNAGLVRLTRKRTRLELSGIIKSKVVDCVTRLRHLWGGTSFMPNWYLLAICIPMVSLPNM